MGIWRLVVFRRNHGSAVIRGEELCACRVAGMTSVRFFNDVGKGGLERWVVGGF